ncbi:unnamed protein product [Oreochromis niloticus]|nr:unnamed protein product [Mustela putorius furo]
MARHLSVLQCLCFVLLVVSLLVLKTHYLLVYERQTLLNIHDSLLMLPSVSERCGGLLPPLASVPEELHRCDPLWNPSKRKRCGSGCMRGTRSEKCVRVRAWMQQVLTISDPGCLGLYFALKQRCLLPVYPTSLEHSHPTKFHWSPCRWNMKGGGANINNLQLLHIQPATTDGQRVNLALLNARSVSNKTYALQTFLVLISWMSCS